MINKMLHALSFKLFSVLILLIGILCIHAQPLSAQTNSVSQTQQLKPLRSDVGIIGLTPNFKWLNEYKYKGSDTLASDGTSELEFKLRDLRMMSPRLGVGFEILTSFFTGGDSGFGIGSWGLGPVMRFYPFERIQLQPYLQGEALFGNNMAAGGLSDTKTGGDGFRVRLGLRGGVAYRLNNSLGFFVEAGPDWESSRIFKSDVRVLQINIGIDLYRFK